MITHPQEKYGYKQVPMGVKNYTDILHEKRNDMFQVFEFLHKCIETYQ